MIRLRMALILLLAACFLFVQGGEVASGALINVSSTSIVAASPQMSGGNQVPVSPPSSIGTPTATTVSSSTTTGTQNISPFSVTSVTSTATNSSSSSTQQLQQQPNTADNNLFQIIEQTETSKLIRVPNFNPLSEKEPLLPSAESYTVTACISYNGIAVSDCHDKTTPRQASKKLAAIILNKYLKGAEARPFRVVLSSAVPLDNQIQLLRKIETQAAAIIAAKMLEDLKRSKMFLSESEEGKQKRLNIIIEDAKQAIQEANNGNNWSHNSKDDRTSHDFQTAKALRQFNNNISVAQLRSH